MAIDREGLLAKSEIFSGMGQEDIALLARASVPRTYAAGQVIIREGEIAVAMFVIGSGRVEVVKGVGHDDSVILATLGPGDFFGEMALFEGFPRSATVRAVEPTECLALSQWDFLAELRTNPDMAVHLIALYARRLRHAQESPTY
jgi:CRP/FNR family cyclic AMP-dependent transcriptional regulator